MRLIRLETERLLIRELSPLAAGSVARFTSENWEFHRWWEPYREPGYFTRRRIARRLRYLNRSKDNFAFWLFERRQTPGRSQPIGSVTLTSIVRGSMQSCFLGYKMDRTFLRRGYMREALGAVLSFSFHQLELHRIEANVMPENEPSQALLRSLGFTSEGVARRYLRIQGAWEDHIHMVLLADEYPGAPPYR